MLDSRYILMQDLQEYFVDKDTGLPLSGGIVTFYSDVNRTVLKNIYQITGSPPNYTYAPLPNPLILSAVGTPQDGSGNDVPVYYFPYDDEGNEELYYITCESSENIAQFTREAWPNFEKNAVTVDDVQNFIDNGQFLIHTNVPATSTTQAGEITQAITILSQGGWSFERPSLTTSVDFVTFERFGSPVTSPTTNPRYACRINTTVPNSGDTFKDLRVKFEDVNKFASDDLEYTFSFSGQTNAGTSTVVNIELIKNYGTGGSSETTTNIGTVTIPASYTIFSISFVFGLNTGKTIGTLDDDFLQIALRFPTAAAFDVSVTDFILTAGEVIITEFPQTTNPTFVYESIAGWADIPDYDSNDLYLPLILTPQGISYDDGEIGQIKAHVTDDIPVSYLECDGTQLVVADYSSDGIPYRRLFNKLWNDTTHISRFGNGTTFVNAYHVEGSTDIVSLFRLTANVSGTCTNSSDGAIPTGFTFNNVSVGAMTYLFSCGLNDLNSDSSPIFINQLYGSNNSIGVGTSGFSGAGTIRQGNNDLTQIEEISAIGASTLAGKYFTIYNTTTSFYVWFTVDGSGSDPSPGGTGIQINLFSLYTGNDVARVISETLNGFHIDNIQTIAASSMTAGSYFNFFTPAGLHYYCYYIIDGVGSDPNVPSAIAIPVEIGGTFTQTQVTEATIVAINSKYYAIPDFRGMHLRGHGINSLLMNTNIEDRFSITNSSIRGGDLGTVQYDAIYSHRHSLVIQTDAGNGSATTAALLGNITNTGSYFWRDPGTDPNLSVNPNSIGNNGWFESRPWNANVHWLVKY